MPKITERLAELLEKREFVSIATCGKDGQPNSVPKFFFRAKGDHLYLIDYVVGKTVENIRQNPQVSVSFMDLDNLEAYRMNGTARCFGAGKLYDKVLKDWDKRVVKLSTDRVIEAVRTGKKRGHYELEMDGKFMVLRIKIENVIKIGRKGDIWKETD